jgi:hypothetical protein
MPTADLKKLSKELNVPLKELEQKWEKAKEIAAKRKGSDWAYTTGIFKNMLSLSKEDIVIPEWWANKKERARKSYLESHPNSKLGKVSHIKVKSIKHKRKTKALDELDKKQDVGAIHSPAVDREEPKSEHEDDGKSNLKEFHPKKKHAIMQSLKKAYGKVKDKISSVFSKHKKGEEALKKLEAGEEIDGVEEAQAKKVSMLTAKNLIKGSLALGLLLSPLGPAAYAVGLLYYDFKKENKDLFEDEDEEEDDEIDSKHTKRQKTAKEELEEFENKSSDYSFQDKFAEGMMKWISSYENPQDLADEATAKYGNMR